MFFFGFYRVVPSQTILSDYGTITMATPLMYSSTSGTLSIYNILSLLTKKKNGKIIKLRKCYVVNADEQCNSTLHNNAIYQNKLTNDYTTHLHLHKSIHETHK